MPYMVILRPRCIVINLSHFELYRVFNGPKSTCRVVEYGVLYVKGSKCKSTSLSRAFYTAARDLWLRCPSTSRIILCSLVGFVSVMKWSNVHCHSLPTVPGGLQQLRHPSVLKDHNRMEAWTGCIHRISYSYSESLLVLRLLSDQLSFCENFTRIVN